MAMVRWNPFRELDAVQTRLNRLSIQGERRTEKEEQGRKYHRVEREYGRFARRRFVRFVFCAALVAAVLTPTTTAQTVATGRLMRDKLTHAQKVIEAIMTSNYAMLDKESAALVKVTEDPAWLVLKTPEYRRYSAAFMRAAQGLEAAATDRDFDAAEVANQALMTSCYQCHRYMKNARLAR
jgi:hypothetical protein